MHLHYILSILITVLGLFGIFSQENLIKKIVSLSIAQTGVIMLFLVFGYDIVTNNKIKKIAPFYDNTIINTAIVDPVPQALMLTAIVVGFTVTAIGLGLAIRLQKSFGTLQDNDISNKIVLFNEK